jgi:hypothetical protein
MIVGAVIIAANIPNIYRVIYGVLLSVLLLQLFIVAVAPFAARVGYPLVVAIPSGVTTTIYAGPVLIVAAMVAGFAVALATPRRYYGIWSGYSDSRDHADCDSWKHGRLLLL